MFYRPSLKQIQSRIENDFSNRLLQGNSFLSRSVLKILSTVYAGACHLMYGFFEWGHKQAFPDTADSFYLERWAKIWNVSRKAGVCSQGMVTGKGNTESMILKDTLLKSNKGFFYVVCENAYPDSNGKYAFLVKSKEIGKETNLESKEKLQAISPIQGVENSFISENISGGADEETDESLRQRLLQVLREPPMGGNKEDYVLWACEVPGVTRAFALPSWLGIGTVGLTFVCDEEENIIPTETMVERVQSYIDELRPLSAELVVFSPTPKPINISIQISPYSENLALRIKLELYDFFRRENGFGKSIPLSHIREIISTTEGEYDHILLTPSENVIVQNHEIAVLGIVTITGVD